MPFVSPVAGFVGLDPRIAAWLIDPRDAAPSFEDLVAKYFKSPIAVNVSTTYRNSSRDVVVSCFKMRFYHCNPNFSLETTAETGY